MKYEGVLGDLGMFVYKTNIFMKTKYIKVNDVVLEKITKNTYGGIINGKYTNAYVYGNILTGCEVNVGNWRAVINFAPKLYEWIIGILPFIMSLVYIFFWGRRLATKSVLALVFGGLLGGIGAFLSLHSIVLIRIKRKCMLYNFLFSTLYLVITLLIYMLLGYLAISIIK
jgi:hypothetical protein